MSLYRYTIDFTRYWSVDGGPFREDVTYAYNPDDDRSHPLPTELFATVEADLEAALGATPVNLWLIDTRTTGGALPLGYVIDPAAEDFIFQNEVPDSADWFNWITRSPRTGVVQISESEYNALVAALALP